MGLTRNRGPYAPQRPVQQVDWAGMQREVDRARAEQARVEEQAREYARQAAGPRDPIEALMHRCHAIEQSRDQIQARLTVAEEQLHTILEHLKGTNHA